MVFVLLLGNLVGCDALSRLHSKNKVEVKGERISALAQPAIQGVEEQLHPQDYSKIVPQNVQSVDSSIGVDSIKYPNILLPDTLKQFQQFSIGTTTRLSGVTSPIVSDDKLIMLDTYGKINAYSITNRKMLWSNSFFYNLTHKGRFSGSTYNLGGMLHTNGVIYATGGLNTVIALNAEDGRLLWSREIFSMTRATPVLHKNILLIQGLDNSLYALHSETGAVVWYYLGNKGEMSITTTTAPVVNNNKVIFTSSAGEIIALDIADGSEVWSYDVAMNISGVGVQRHVYDVVHQTLMDGKMLITYGNDGAVMALDAGTGIPIWRRALYVNRPIWSYGDLLIGITEYKQLVAFSKLSGKTRWVVDLSAHLTDSKLSKKEKSGVVWMQPIVTNGNIMLVNSVGQLLKFGIGDGSLVSIQPVLSGVYNPPIVSNGSLFLISSAIIAQYK
ncbi:PQQ-binding-like beta-propeller repeat protein [Rickettsiales endosymbiont of Peranema trichophorum]|uniref:PQQ-binding-like beta-propeller repeat protein n=1 Tax=Rickettsiales endosymbiont of Peranema trichophorum TaxID=2486577 RepID=UPI0013EECD0E|nr:PQQ-binding-like beta-propeller repeat protein [Rickettsiales endosymbiont of Peranema trichophorum]